MAVGATEISSEMEVYPDFCVAVMPSETEVYPDLSSGSPPRGVRGVRGVVSCNVSAASATNITRCSFFACNWPELRYTLKQQKIINGFKCLSDNLYVNVKTVWLL